MVHLYSLSKILLLTKYYDFKIIALTLYKEKSMCTHEIISVLIDWQG